MLKGAPQRWHAESSDVSALLQLLHECYQDYAAIKRMTACFR